MWLLLTLSCVSTIMLSIASITRTSIIQSTIKGIITFEGTNDIMPGRGEDVSDAEILQRMREADDAVLTTKEIADMLPIKRNATLRRLRKLADKNKIRTKSAGSGTVWWLPERAH